MTAKRSIEWKRLGKLLSAMAASAGALITALVFNTSVFAQCVMCRSSVEGSADAAKLSNKIDLGVIVLFIPVLSILSTIGVVIYRYRNSFGESQTEVHEIEALISKVD
jgi:hypothetical protein